MTNEKVIVLIEAKIQPQRCAELLEAAGQYLPLVRAEPGVEAFYLTARKDDPNTIVFYEIYRSQTTQDLHLHQDFTKKFVTILKNAAVGDVIGSSAQQCCGCQPASGHRTGNYTTFRHIRLDAKSFPMMHRHASNL